MAAHLTTDIAVIGAGVVGMTIALRLADLGRDVMLVDPAEMGSGASYGNAGTIADYAVLPVGTPEVLKNLPSLLLNRNSPLSIRKAALPSLAPWLLRFARQSLPAAAHRNANSIAALMARATSGWQELAAEVNATALLQARGCLYAYETTAAYRAAGADATYRRDLGVAMELVDAHTLAQMEPGLPPMAGAAFFPNAVFLSDPVVMMARLAAALVAAGVPHHRARVDRIERMVDGIRLTGPHRPVHARRVVIAAGAHSRALAVLAGDKLPLDTERGYHVEWDMARPKLSRPTCPSARGFYLCPMTGRLRVAGTVELGGLTAPPSRHRITKLVKGAQAIFPELGPPDREWMGFRPSMPDSLPVIGPSKRGADILYAFGHGHIGVTLAPITARIITDLLTGKPPELDLTSYSARRFG